MIYENLIFIHIPRTGGTSIESTLNKKMDNDTKHKTALEIRREVGEEKWNDSFVFSFVRNPWDRIISLYHQPFFRNKREYGNKDLAYFIQKYQPTPWEKKFYFEYLNTDGIDFIGRFENRTEDLDFISQKSGIEIDSKLHERKTSRELDYRSYFDDQTKDMIGEMYQEDIKKYGYFF